MKWSVVCILLFVVVSRPARADEIDDVSTLIDDGHSGEAYRRITPLVLAHPKDPRIRYLAALACQNTARDDEALGHADAGLASAPDDVDLLAVSGHLFLEAGDLEQARAALDRAHALDGDDAFVADQLEWLGQIEQGRARRAGKPFDLEPGSAGWFVDHVMERAFDDATPLELSTFISAEILKHLPHRQQTRRMLQVYVRMMMIGMQSTHTREHQHADGWLVADVAIDGDRTNVVVWVPTHLERSRSTVDEEVRKFDAGEVGTGAVATALAAVDVEERPALIDRLVGEREQITHTVRFELIPHGDSWRITNVILNNSDTRASMQAEWDKLGIEDEPEPKAGDIAERLGRLVGGAGVLIGIIVVVVYFSTRRPAPPRHW